MKLKFVLLVIPFLAAISCTEPSLPKVLEQNKHFNHHVFEDNKLPPRATFFAFESPEMETKENSRRYLNLNGDWKFLFVKDPKERPTTFHNIDFIFI